jgi:hypothetical protein
MKEIKEQQEEEREIKWNLYWTKNQNVTEGNREQPLKFNFPKTRSYAEEKT